MSGESTAAPKWASSVVLGSGDTAFIRPLTPADKPALAEFHRRQSPESIYRRYFSPKPELSDKELDHFTAVDMVDRAALAVEAHDEFIGWASYERWPGRDEAEAAFMVDDAHHGEGIATLLLEHLAAIARSNGIERFTAEVLGDNRAMLAVFAKAGWPLQRRFESGVVDLDWELASTEEFLDSVERREQRADSRAVARLLMPRAVAVIGASQTPGSVGDAIWRNVVNGVDAPVYAVNPRHDTVHGHPCHRSIDGLPDEVSLAIIAVPAAHLEATVDACIAKRMRGAVIVTSVDGSDVDVDAMVARARRNGLRIIGPSSMGVASPRPETRLQAALVEVTLPPGGVAISMQSGSLGGSFLRKALDVGLGVSWFVSLGDKSDISANDLLQFWEFDDNTTVVAMYTESFGNPRKFARIARRVSRTRPIVAVRTGAAAAGDMGSALYQQAGLIEVPTVPALLETVRVLATQPVLQGPRVAVLTNSRSPGILAGAALEAAGLVAVDGPIALGWSARAADYPVAMRAALDDDDIDGLLVIHAPAVADDVESAAKRIDDGARGATKPVVAVMLGGVDGPVAPGSAVPAFMFPEQAAAVLGRSHAYGCWLREDAARDDERVRPVDPAAAHQLITSAIGDSGEDVAPLDLVTTRRLLSTYGLDMAEAVESTPASAVEAARGIGFPVAVKAVRRRPGRSARAGVALDLVSPDDVAEAVAVMQESLGADADDLVVQSMTSPGVDVRIRCEHDERLGAIVTVGLGGAQADAIDDRTSRLAPVSPASATSMLSEGRLAAALANSGIDSWPVVDAIVLAAQLASDHPEIAELDLNPVIVSEVGAVVTDARVRLVSHVAEDGPLRRLD
ncbi:MAG TPA: GNAT family N-acetyltransferase [Ilumatobacteraceae bacterium]|nr:GNAT family N-acetyltransferase [Ilumatobacteraceae bacterium]